MKVTHVHLDQGDVRVREPVRALQPRDGRERDRLGPPVLLEVLVAHGHVVFAEEDLENIKVRDRPAVRPTSFGG